MKTSELRIGNLVDLGNRIAKVIEINHLSCVVVDLEETQDTIEDYERIKPIPLTEEWLLKFGFVKSKVSSQFDKEKLTIQIANELEYHKKGRVYFNSWAILEESIKYVHQLQNLYFALIGEELTFKSE